MAYPVTPCVRCGKCLAGCRYYLEYRREELSPRGRFVMAEQPGFVNSVLCLACGECGKICPFDLSSLDLPVPRFHFEKVMCENEEIGTEELFRVIYNDARYITELRRRTSPVVTSDPLVAAWLVFREIPAVFTGEDEQTRDSENLLFNPFAEYTYENTSPALEKWKKIIRKREEL